MKKILIFCSIATFSSAIKSQTIPFGISKDSIYLDFINVSNHPYQYGQKKHSMYYYKPLTYNSATSPVLIAIPGTGWDGDMPINDLMTIADRRGALIVGLNLYTSGVTSAHSATYKFSDSLRTVSSCWQEGPATKTINAHYKHILLREGRTEAPVYMIGHSAGGQFVTRYMLIRQAYPDSVPIKMAVSANPYYYAFPTDTLNGVPMQWLSGLLPPTLYIAPYSGDCPENLKFFEFGCPDHIKQYYNENYGVLIGTADTATLNDNASAMAQGSNRYQRAQNFYNFGLTDAPNYGTTLNWKYREVVGVGHDGYQMYNSKNLSTDTFTIAERLLFETPYVPTIQLAPVASFTADTTIVTQPNAVIQFANNSSGATSYEWDFGDGTTSTLTNPTHTYINTTSPTTYTPVGTSVSTTTPGQYFMVQLKAMSTNSCENWDIKRNHILVLPDPATGLNNYLGEGDNVLVLPNPANDEVTIKWEISNTVTVFSLYNSVGELLKEITTNESQLLLNAKQLANGLYFVKLSYGKNVATKKLLIAH